MKKRLLSAALALAMVLTLLPVSAFAADTDPTSSDPKTTTVQYVSGEDFSKPKEGGGYIKDTWTWSYKSTVDSKTYWADGSSLSGIVAGTSASGRYYPAASIADDSGKLVTTSFTIVGQANISVTADHLGTSTSSSLSVNTFGGTLMIADDALNKMNSLTVTDTAATPGTVSALTRNVGNYNASTDSASKSTSGLNLSITNAKSSGISLTGRANTVTLTNVALTGNIIMDGTTTVTPASGTPTKTVDRQTLNTNPQAVWPYGKSSVSGKVEVTGNGSTVNLRGTEIKGAVTVTSTGGSLTVDNGTTTGLVTIASGDEKATDAPPTVTVNDGSVAGITYALGTTSTAPASNITVNAQGSSTAAITVDSGTVNIHSANVDDITLKMGTLNMDGTSGTAGDITLAGVGKTTFNFSGTGWTVDKLATTNGNLLTVGTNWPTGRSNTFTELDLDGYTGQGIKGGIVGGAKVTENRGWFAPDLQFARKADTLFALYGTRELAAAIADAGSDAATKDNINVIGAEIKKYVSFYNSMLDVNSSTANPIAWVGYGKSTGIYLPDKINGTAVATWTNLADAKEYGVNEEVPISIEATEDIKMVLQSTGAAVSRLTNVTTSGENKNVTATLSNNQIVLSGAVGQDSYEDVKLTLTTDLIDDKGAPVTFDVLVSYNTDTKTSAFSTLGMKNPPLGVTVNSNNIVIGSNTYTLTTSALAKPAANLQVAGIGAGNDYAYTGTAPTGKSIVPTVNVSGMGNVTKQELIDKLSAGSFEWSTSPAMRQVVNQAMATITANNTLENYVTAAQRAAWTALGNKGKTPSETDLSGTGYTTAVLEPYLALTVTAYNASGTMTATLVPSYRVIVVSSVAANMTALAGKSGFTTEGYYIAQQGRALNTPITDLVGGETGVTLTLCGTGDKALPTGFGTSTVLHQDGTYAYTTTTANEYVLTHGGKTGLGTIVLNATQPLVSLLPAGGTANQDEVYYDDLQAAISDTKPSATADKYDKITVNSAYTGSGVIDVTGEARTFKIETLGQTTITPANNNFTVGVDTTGHTYTVQLTKSVAAPGENIVVASATGGSASVSTKSATAGQTVTVTLNPSTGYTGSGVSVKDSSGNTVSTTGSGNSYSFTMPSGGVTVTPSFSVVNTKVKINTNSSSMGTVTASAAEAEPGTRVTVTLSPAAGYRTMGISGVSGATRTGDNSFIFTVPNTTSVTITPSFDVNNGTRFSDVWSNSFYSSAVNWAYNKVPQVTDGTSTYTFSPENKCSRGQMVTFLYRAAGEPSVYNVSNPFVDIVPGSYYYNAVLWAVSQGITRGTDATHFSPDRLISRSEAVTFLYRYEKSPAVGSYIGFADVPAGAFYTEAVIWANSRNVTNGTSATTFTPDRIISRGEAVTFLYRDATGNR